MTKSDIQRIEEAAVFTENYFDGKIMCETLAGIKKLIHKHHANNVRVQIGNYRLLLHPSDDNGVTRKIDGFSDLAETYRYFNNLTEDGLSCIGVGSDGRPGGIYYSNVKPLNPND